MEAIPSEWIDKLFHCMQEFYGDRWKRNFDKPYLEGFYKTIWRNGLCGLTYDQIKYQLQRCKRHSEDPSVFPPIVMEFFRHAKEGSEPHINYHPKANVPRNTELAKEHLSIIRQRLG